MKLLKIMVIACLGLAWPAMQASQRPTDSIQRGGGAMQRRPQWVPLNQMPAGMQQIGAACRVKVGDKVAGLGRLNQTDGTCTIFYQGKTKAFKDGVEVLASPGGQQSIKRPNTFQGHGPAQMPQRNSSGSGSLQNLRNK